VLALASGRPEAFDAGDLTLAEAIGDELGIAIQNLRLAARSREEAAAAERARLARELHDDTAQQLVAIARQLDLVGASVGPEAAEQVERIQDMVDAALRNVRRISRDLRPAVLEDLGLVAALEAIVADAQRNGGPAVELRVEGESRPLPARSELALYRIAQQALANSLAHATASRVAIELGFDAEGATLAVRDDGRGFAMPTNLAELEKGGGLGVIGMRERADEVGGRLEIEAAPGAGAVVRVRVASPA
jgi:signal transduction histidine kinase